MSKKKTDTGKQSPQKSGKQTSGKPAAKAKPAPAKVPAKKPAPPKPAPPKPKPAPQKQYEIVKPAASSSKASWTPAGMAIVAVGAALFIVGAVILGKIQYAKAGTGGFAAGVGLMILGIVIPCAAVPVIRELLFPRKTTEDLEITPADKSGK